MSTLTPPAPPPNAWLLAADRLDPPPWRVEGRLPLGEHQQPPPGEWDVWILTGGRAAGKTEGAARFYCEYMRNNPGTRGRIIGYKLADVWESCILGPSGIKTIDPDVLVSHGSGGKPPSVTWPNGSNAILLCTWTPRDVEGLRAAGNRWFDWWEEMAANRNLEIAWPQAAAGLRGPPGVRTVTIGSTTPRGFKFYQELRQGRVNDNPIPVAVTHGTMFDNPGVDEARKQALIRDYEGTRIARQELWGEDLTDVPGAVWRFEDITREPPPDRGELVRVSVGVDPAGGGGEDAAEMGVVVCGKGRDGRGYVLADRTRRGTPDEICQVVWGAVDAFEADVIVVEKNHGGDWIPSLLRAHRRTGGAAIKVVTASRSKRTRAEPIGAQYEQGKWVHTADPAELAKLEDQMTSWVPDEGMDSPDRMDALVWAATDLGVTGQANPRRPRPAAEPPSPRERAARRPLAGLKGRAW